MDNEEIVMTPTKHGKTTRIHIEKKPKGLIDHSLVAHVAGGQHTGLVINKQTAEIRDASPANLQLEFKCFLVNHKSGKHIPESRVLKFWFAADTDYLDKVTTAYEFFKELVKPENFPRDYTGFIKRVMKQVQQPQYTQMKKVEVDLTQLEELETPLGLKSGFSDAAGIVKEDTRPKEVVVQEQLLLTLESAYPNILQMDDLASMTGCDERMVKDALKLLQGRNLVKEVEPGRYVRQVLDQKTEVKVFKQMPVQAPGQKPTVAIITAKYYEKLAVDAMMENKTTFVKFKSEGDSNVYTIGDIGTHKVVSTKIPQLGRQLQAQIASGSTTTRLLGTFNEVEHVFLVGVAGGVPHYTDYNKHVRLGDIIFAVPNQKGVMYIFCDKLSHDPDQGKVLYTLKSWSPEVLAIQDTAQSLAAQHETNPSFAPWEKYMTQGQELLKGQEVNFSRPPPETDRLYMNIGGNDVIEVGHPPPPEGAVAYRPGAPAIRSGAIGSGKPVVQEDALRLDFSARHGCVAFDTEFDQVMESVVGNRKESFAFIRGAADYLDGTKNQEWQPYAALAAAAFMKAVIEKLPAPGATR